MEKIFVFHIIAHKRSLNTKSEIFVCVSWYSSPFPIKMNATDAKTQKIEPDLFFFFLMDVGFGDSVENVRLYLFSKCEHLR